MRCELTARLGVGWVEHDGVLDLACVPDGLRDVFSQRSAQVDAKFADLIERWSAEHGGTDPEPWTIAQLERAAVIASRPAKTHGVDAGALHREWAGQARRAGFDPALLDRGSAVAAVLAARGLRRTSKLLVLVTCHGLPLVLVGAAAYGSEKSPDIVRLTVYTVHMAPTQLREPTFLILTSLAAGPRHGYGILRDVAELSDGRVTLRAGTLYGSLDRLVEQGLAAPDREEVEQGRLRRYYRITGEGRAVLTAEVARLDANARAASHRLGLSASAHGRNGVLA